MGQKTDTKSIFQIGKNNKKYIWDSKYFEKRKNESNVFVFQSMEIKKFIKKILNDNGLTLYKYKINFLESTIKISISYLKLPKSQNIITQINSKQKLKLVKKNKTQKNFKKTIKEYLVTKKNLKNKKILELDKNLLNEKVLDKQKVKICLINNIILNKQKNILKKDLVNFIFLKKVQDKIKNFYDKDGYNKKFEKIISKLPTNENKIKKRIKILQYYKYYSKIKNNKIIKNIKINNFLEKIVESLNIFTNNKFNIVLNLQQVNKNLNL